MTLPAPASSMFWRLQPEVYQLMGMKCSDCGYITHPRRKVCPQCGGFNIQEYKLSKKGTIHTFCINYATPPEMEAPLPIAIIDLDGGGKYQGLLADVSKPEDVKIGVKVEAVLRKLYRERGLNVYGYKFKLIEEA